MSAGLYALIGVIIGAASTGVVQAVLDAQARRRATRVSARLLLNSLKEYLTFIPLVLDHGDWPSNPVWTDAISSLPAVWSENQRLIAESTSLELWIDVSNFFVQAYYALVFGGEGLAREKLTAEDRKRLNELLEQMELARKVLIPLSK